MAKIVSDIVVDLQYGDSGKGKVAYHLAKHGSYTHVVRYSGGSNAGHTVYHNQKKFVTHIIPMGVFFGIPSIIGAGCVVNVKSFFDELQELEDAGINARELVRIAENTHIVTPEHIKEEEREEKIGTTKRGIGPAYRDKYMRVGVLAKDINELKPFIIDTHELFHNSKNDMEILCEGAQGYGLDIDWGNYPYVTSSHPTVAGALISGIPRTSIRDVWGVIKAYETYVGANAYQKEDPLFERIQEAGGEFGATTGRVRQVGWNDVDLITRGAQHNSITKLVINKVDILRDVQAWGILINGKEQRFETEEAFTEVMCNIAQGFDISQDNIYFSESPDKI